MPKRNYGKIKQYENEILAMKEAGYTKRKIAEEMFFMPNSFEWVRITALE